MVSELYKIQVHRGEQPDLRHYRESRGLEMDLLVSLGDRLYAVEAKSAATATAEFFKGFAAFAGRMGDPGPAEIANVVVYGDESSQQRSAARLVAWRDVGKILPDIHERAVS